MVLNIGKHEMQCIETQIVELTIYKHEVTGRLLALCEDVKGFAAQARDMEQLKERVPRLMKALLEAKGAKIERVEFVEDVKPDPIVGQLRTDEQGIDPSFIRASMIAQAEICLAA